MLFIGWGRGHWGWVHDQKEFGNPCTRLSALKEFIALFSKLFVKWFTSYLIKPFRLFR
jgi:hypothetical protein